MLNTREEVSDFSFLLKGQGRVDVGAKGELPLIH